MNDASPHLYSLFRDRRNVYLRVLTRRLGDAEAAEETLQEAFIHFDRAEKTEKIVNPDAYLMQIALNLAVDRIRQDASRRKREEKWFEAHAGGRAGVEYIAQTPSPDQTVIARDEIERLQNYLTELTPRVREAFILHKVKGLSHSETAEQMKLSRSTVEKHIMKAMRHLLDRMGDRDA